jgi:hypothetical protein
LTKDWESTFRRWSKPSSETEAEKQENAERMIRNAIREYLPLKAHQVSVFAQGSYRNNTNVRQDSDVDICVCCRDTFFFDFSFADYSKGEAGIVDASYSFATFKNEVQKALEQGFGLRGVTRGNKAIDVHENSYRVDADVFCAFEYRLYRKRSYVGAPIGYVLPPGVKAFSDSGVEITNWPEQNYANGVAKNTGTSNRFKLIVRCMKNLRNEMAERGLESANPIASFLIECLIYNVPDVFFAGDSYSKNVRDCVAFLYNAMGATGNAGSWYEVNGIKYLFHSKQPWTREQVSDFLLQVWRYCEFV